MMKVMYKNFGQLAQVERKSVALLEEQDSLVAL
jgi:hypothetical protein